MALREPIQHRRQECHTDVIFRPLPEQIVRNIIDQGCTSLEVLLTDETAALYQVYETAEHIPGVKRGRYNVHYGVDPRS